MVTLSMGYLEMPEPEVREGISGQLLAQAAAEMQVASELLEIAREGQTGKPRVPTTRAAHGVALRDTIADLEKAMAHPVAEGLPVEFRTTGLFPQPI